MLCRADMPAQLSRLNELRGVAWVELSTHTLTPPHPAPIPRIPPCLPSRVPCQMLWQVSGLGDRETDPFRKTVGLCASLGDTGKGDAGDGVVSTAVQLVMSGCSRWWPSVEGQTAEVK